MDVFTLLITVIIGIYVISINHKLYHLKGKVERLMTAIRDFADQVNAQFTAIGESVDGIVLDIDWLKEKIDELQNSPGTLTPEDQALLDEIQSKVGTLADTLAALDAATDPNEVPEP